MVREVVLLDTGTPGTSREIFSEDAAFPYYILLDIVFKLYLMKISQIKTFQEPNRQVNHKTAHSDKTLVVTMFKRPTDPSIPVLSKLRKLRSNQYTAHDH